MDKVLTASEPFLHATTVVLGADGILIRGAAGSGKTMLALAIVAAAAAQGRFARLVADDRTMVEARAGRLLARPPPTIAGLVERRGRGIETVAYEPACVVRLVVDLVEHAPRLPSGAEAETAICGVALPRRIAPAGDALAAMALTAYLVGLRPTEGISADIGAARFRPPDRV